MECERYNALLSAYADGMLSRRQAGRVARHVATCRRCREDLAEIQVLRRLLHALPSPEPRERFWDEAHRLVRTGRPSRRRPHIRVTLMRHGWALAAAGTVVAMLLSNQQPLDRVPLHADTLSVSPEALVALHASAAADRPMADEATLRYSSTESRAADWAADHQLDAD